MKGHIRKRGEHSWALIIDVGRTEGGRRRQKWHTVHGTKKHAQSELTRLLRERDTGEYVEPSKLTVGAYLDDWLCSIRQNVTARTFARYSEIVACHLKPAIGARPLAGLNPIEIDRCYREALEHGRRDGKGGLSPTTVLQHHRILKEALKRAVRLRLVARNPADAVDPPRKASPELRVLDGEAIGQVLQAARGTRYYFPALLGVATGMRRGELLALRWCDTDLEHGSVAVHRSAGNVGLEIQIKEPKSRAGVRTIPLPAFALDALKTHRAEQAKERLLLGGGYVDNGLVFPQVDGKVWLPDGFTSGFRRLMQRHGLAGVRFHDLRHAHATQLLSQGVHAKVVSERLGHSTISITMDIYSHVMPALQSEAAQKIEAALGATVALQG